MKLRILLSFFFVVIISLTIAQNRLKPYEEYIRKYSDIAVDQQKKYKIPAGVTMAQGLLESGAGRSQLARKSNNHFGIKCHSTWRGDTVIAFDDNEYTCFRKYEKVADSYKDHSEFLTRGARYRPLFNLDMLDYKSWARGLQKAGYATDANYADKLIRTIETYDLNELTKDGKLPSGIEKFKEKKVKKIKVKGEKKTKNPFAFLSQHYSSDVIKNAKDYNSIEPDTSKYVISPLSTHIVSYVGTTPCIIVQYDDSYESIAEEFGLSKRRIIKCNDFPDNHVLKTGEIVYLDTKATWWEGENPIHRVKEGETMLSISQKYGLKLKALYKMNDMKPGTDIHSGQAIKLRNPDQMSPFIKAMNESFNKIDTTKTK